ncbi:hypothetical protein [Bacteroides sp. 1_1_14]|uniref:hypothetical protein n=1 Tax=Bacteroides sp. 1_1_14 TaxID=469585 RepID=UPI0001D89D00|nr:hypothetical protein [Bacteroides sp. 1_1_14]EFI04439.1 hypothetical protein HMPREF9007_02100 [Bacteroides sp. 1_1_14]
MRPKSVILLSVIVTIGGILFFLACKYTYDFKITELKEKARETFVKAVDQELKNRNLKDEISFNLKTDAVRADVSDTVYWEDETGRHYCILDNEKKQMNITNDGNLRALHTFAFSKKPLHPDSLNIIWDGQLNKSDISFKSALCISLMDNDGNVKLQNKSQDEYGNSANVVFTFYIGYVYEIKVIGYLYYSVWSMIYKETLLYLLLYVILGYGFYKSLIILRCKIHLLHTKEIVEIVKEVPVEVVKEVPVEIIKEIPVEKQIIKEVQRVENIPLRSYLLGENIIFYADQNIIEINDVKQKIQAQSSLLLELFIQQKDNGYILEEDFINEKLWPNYSGYGERMHTAIGRLRSVLRKIDPSFSIINKSGTYQLIIPEKLSNLV